MVRALRAELGSEHVTVQRVAQQLGYGIESVRSWVRQADEHPTVEGTASEEAITGDARSPAAPSRRAQRDDCI